MKSILTLALFVSSAMLGVAQDDDVKILFNGTDFSGWQTANGKAVEKGWKVIDGAMVCTNEGGGNIFTTGEYGNFELSLEFQTTGNSGVLLRCSDPTDYIQTCIEVQIDNAQGKPGKHSVGALYDLVKPFRENVKNNEWNTMTVRAQGNVISVKINDEAVSEMNLDNWTKGNENPDGTKNKFKKPLKEFKREGHIGLQDHGNKVMYRNLRLKPLGAAK